MTAQTKTPSRSPRKSAAKRAAPQRKDSASMPSQVLSRPLTQLEAQGYVAYHQGVLAKNNPYHRDEQPEFWLQWFRGWHLGFDTRTMILGHQFHSAQQQPATL